MPRSAASRLIAILVSALLAAACGNGDDADEAEMSRAPGAPTATEPPSLVGPPTTTSVPPAAVDPGPSGTASTPTSTSAPATTTPPTAPPAAGPASAASPVPPPAPGTYFYDTSGQSSYPGLGGGSAPYPAITTLVVDPPVGSRQHATRNLKDTSGNGPVIETRFDYRPDGVYLESLQLSVTVLLFSDTQEFRPPTPTLVLPTDARPGYSRELTVHGRVAPARLTIDLLREEQVSLGGQDVPTTVVRLTAATTGQFNAHMELTVWLARSTGVWVKERSVSEASTPDGQPLYQGQYEATLQRLTPG